MAYAGLRARVLTAVVGIPLVFLALRTGGVWWAALTGAVALLGWREYARLFALTPTALGVVITGGGLVFLASAWGAPQVSWGVLMAWVVVIAVAGALLLRSPAVQSPVRITTAAVFGPFYLGMPMAMLARWRIEYVWVSVVAFLLLIWANDTAAYFAGSAFGRHKLAPRISPGKSWEGAVAGAAAGAAVGAIAAGWLGLGAATAALFGLLVTIASQMGDLFESAMKRRAGVKDSGTLLPGHGGVLDRFDGIFFAGPIGYALLAAFTR